MVIWIMLGLMDTCVSGYPLLDLVPGESCHIQAGK